jgi:uncharacterized membrane protein YdjX (TVP38/TMEM64 family)
MVLLLGVIVFAVSDYKQLLRIASHFMLWVREEPIQSSVIIFLLYVVGVVTMLPTNLLTMALGYAYARAFENKIEGYAFGIILIPISTITGALCALLLSRYLFGRSIKNFLISKYKTFKAIDTIISNGGWKTIFLIRMTPIPFTITSYLMGVTSVSIKNFCIGSCAITIKIAL